MDCPFCNIPKEKILKQGKNVCVILSNPRLRPGHALVIPKQHALKLSELDEDTRKELLDTAIEFQEKIISKVSSGCDIRQNYRPFLKQSKLKVDHVHLHVLPRDFEDELYQKSQIYEKEIFKDLSDEEKEKFSKLLAETKNA